MPTATARATAQVIEIRPQSGKQETFLASDADIAFYGGAAGGGKTWSLLLEPLYHYKTPGFGAVIFRRTFPEIDKKGGMWDESGKLYPLLGFEPNEASKSWTYPINKHQSTTIDFAHCQHEKDVLSWKGAQIPLIGIDQIESFTEFIFWYLLSRNRSMCGVHPYLRATCNPVPADDPIGGWLHKLMGWWIGEDGYAIEARSGVLRWFVRVNDAVEWADTQGELAARFPGQICHLKVRDCAMASKDGIACDREHAKSFTFIPSKLTDNKALMRVDPGYMATLKSLPMVERERLLSGNWHVRPTAGMVFNRAWFEIVEAAPVGLTTVRYWDKAGSEGTGCYTAGVKMGKDLKTGLVYVLDVVRGQWSAGARENVIRQCAQIDGTDTKIYAEQEPGSGGKESAQNTVLNLQGFAAHADLVRGNKLKRAEPLSAYAEAGNVKLLRGEWNEAYLDELHSFDPDADVFKDQVDASSGCFNKLSLFARPLTLYSAGTSSKDVAVAVQSPVEAIIQRQKVYWPGDR